MTGATPVLSAADVARLLRRDPPTAEQAAVVEAPLGPALVVAGAGSGKTETMSSRVVWLIANGLVAPEQVLGLTFTRKAAGELADRVRRRLRHLALATVEQGLHLPGLVTVQDTALATVARPTVSTYNAYAAGLVGDHGLRLGVEPSARLLGEAAQWQLASQVVESWTADLGSNAAVSTVVEAVLTMSGALDEHLLTAEQARSGIEDIVEAIGRTPAGEPPRGHYAKVLALLSSLGERTRLLELVDEYRRRKSAADSLDFGDQVAIAARLAQDVPEVGAGERDRYRVVLLDEYQDTSYAQLVLLSALFGDGHPVTAVGDPHQSIYGWRGASAGGLERFPETFPVVEGDRRRPADVHRLSTSWRNDVTVLDAANLVAAPLRRRVRVELPELTPRPGAGPGRVVARYDLTVEDEARAVAEFVAERWHTAGAPGSGPTGVQAAGAAGGRVGGPAGGATGAPGAHAPGVPHPAAPAAATTRVSAAVLCRKRAQFPVLHAALRDAGLPVEVVGLGGLLDTPEVVDLVALLQAAHDPSRGDALMRLLTGARTRIGAADLHALAEWATELADGGGRRPDRRTVTAVTDVVEERSIVDAVDQLPPEGWTGRTGRTLSTTGRTRLLDLSGTLRALRAHTYLSLPELVVHAERLWGLDLEVAARPGVGPGRARAHLDAFRDVAVQYSDATDDPTLGGFLAWLDSADVHEHGLDMPVAEPDPDAVQLITVHAAKGLEWDVVAVAGLVDGGLPSTRTQTKDGPTDSAWLTGLGELPYPLRGDRDDLPELDYAGAADPKDLDRRLTRFRRDAGDHQVAEERRLAYVAFTRARSDLLLTGAWWGDGSRPRPPSLFWSEVVESGAARLEELADQPDPDQGNPRDQEPVTAIWPADPFGPAEATSGPGAEPTGDGDVEPVPGTGRPGSPAVGSGRRAAVQAAADAVRAARVTPPDLPSTPWDRTVERLLAERESARQVSEDVELPAHLSASAVVRLAGDPGEFARALRRPVPQQPSPQARRGTRFHAWVEGRFGRAALVDVDDLPGADDDSVPVDADETALRERFLATEWAELDPVAVEVDVETTVGGYVLRSRIDAVFPDPARPDVPGAVVVVDWKTGAPPSDPQARRVREMQLAVYRLAWSRWTGTALDLVDAAFCYVGAGRTVRPEQLLGAEEVERLLLAVTQV